MKLRSLLIAVQVLFVLLASLSAPVAAAEEKLPFGIRNYDIGLAPNFELEDIDGELFDLKSTRGQWVFLHFWASWCGPCREEMPTIQALSESIDEDKLHFVLVNTAEDEDTIFMFLGSVAANLTSMMDQDGLVTEIWKPRGLPTTFLIDPDGRVRYQAIGGREWNHETYIQFISSLISN
ncbi:MAG: TlpA family protein disulfide reductase [Gammaproteobacteria bacterium]|nr:TlpA family protein disulfide reductase [Gammaproteobacteria bacterium]MCK5263236.1 TlpA family protein disulfide reductase [Gammaproteobacteria bacterium]